MAAKAKRQIAKPTKRQTGFAIAQNILGQISQLAGGVRGVMQKGQGMDIRTGAEQPIGCAPSDVRHALSPEQSAAIDEFIATWAPEEVKPEPK